MFSLDLKLTIAVLGFVLFLLTGQMTAQNPGSLDMSFGNGGKVITPFTNFSGDFAYAVAIQSDGKIVSAGTSSADFALTRHNPDGSLDNSFGAGGKITTSVGSFIDASYAVTLQPDGKIVAAGYTFGTFEDFALVRYNTDGTLDSSFGTGGKVITAIGTSSDVASSLAIQTDGKIIAAGFTYSMNEDFALVRYNTDGTLDNTFGVGGKVITQIASGSDFLSAIAIQSDGKIVAVGSSKNSNLTNPEFTLIRYDSDGSLDNTFGTGGIVTTVIGNSSAHAVALQPDGRIVVAGQGGTPNNDFALARYNTNGTLDTSFGTNGIIRTTITGTSSDIAEALVIQSNGKIVAIGYTISNSSAANDFALARYNIDGSLDNSFGLGGKVVTPVGNSQDTALAAAIQSDGKIMVAGFSLGSDADFALVRYLGDAVVRRRTLFDFDGDARADISVFRPLNGVWYVLNPSSEFTSTQFGISTDKLAPADFDGDGKTDLGVYRDGNWFMQRSTDGFLGFNFGLSTDVPMPADFDGDGKAEIAVFRPTDGVWYIYNLANNQFNAIQFGQTGDFPVANDYDGDGKSDIAVFRNGTWYLLRSRDGFAAATFGLTGDKSVPADYDGDGKADLAVFRPTNGTWYLQLSSTGFAGVQFGIAADKPSPADYDGDGKADISVFRDGVWYLLGSQDGFASVTFGTANDKSVPNAFVP
jgi:uncharacterized delta-60 repeat protein